MATVANGAVRLSIGFVPIHIDLNKLRRPVYLCLRFVHKSWNFCSYHNVISILAMLREMYLNLGPS